MELSMFPHFKLILLILFGTAWSGAALAEPGPVSGWSVAPKKAVLGASYRAQSDGVGSGWCGRGTLSVLRHTGMGEGLLGANGHDWEKRLWVAGWRPLTVRSPADAPYGSVLVYQSDYRRLGRNERKTAGGRYGHVEFVAWDSKLGGRVYVSDAARKKPGGTVLDNFTRRAWISPCFVETFSKGGRFPSPQNRPAQQIAKASGDSTTGPIFYPGGSQRRVQ